MNKYLNYLHFGLTVLIGVVVLFGLGSASAPLGGVTNFDQLDAANPPSGGNAYTVSSTAVINAAGQYVAGIKTSASSTYGVGIGFSASSTGLLLRGAGSTCYSLFISATGGIATSTITCAGI